MLRRRLIFAKKIKDSQNILSDIVWEAHEYNGNTGVLIVNPDARTTSFFDISAYAGYGVCLMLSGFTLSSEGQKILFYDNNFVFLSGAYSSDSIVLTNIPSNAKYAKISLSFGGINDGEITVDSFVLMDNISTVADDFTTEGYYDLKNGSFVNDSRFNSYLIKTQNSRFAVKGVVSGAFYDNNMKFISGISYIDDKNASKLRLLTVPDAAAFAWLNCFNSATGKLYINYLSNPDFFWKGAP